jgi:hypothetical protein
MARLPDFLIIGAARCGTSSLFSNLLKHPRIRGPHLPRTSFSNEKEAHFFDKKIHRGFSLSWYENRFNDPGRDIVFFEATPNYLYHPAVPKLVKKHMAYAKFIVMLRNPVNRAWSHFYHWRSKCGWDVSVLKQKGHEIVKKGIYHEQLERWFEYFPRDKFLIIKSEVFYRNETPVIKECFNFLGLEKCDFDQKSITYWDPKREYLTARRTYDKPPNHIVGWLRNFYAPHNERLEKMLNREFGWD